jgi:hypothetical protein
MNTNAKVPMNSATSLGAREFGIADLQKRTGGLVAISLAQ